MKVLLVGRRRSVIDDVVGELDAPAVDFSAATSLDEARTVVARTELDHVVLGGGLDLDTRLTIVRQVFESSASTTVHMNSPSGPESFLPFVRSVLRGLTDSH
jgi:hypothetical protein